MVHSRTKFRLLAVAGSYWQRWLRQDASRQSYGLYQHECNRSFSAL